MFWYLACPIVGVAGRLEGVEGRLDEVDERPKGVDGLAVGVNGLQETPVGVNGLFEQDDTLLNAGVRGREDGVNGVNGRPGVKGRLEGVKSRLEGVKGRPAFVFDDSTPHTRFLFVDANEDDRVMPLSLDRYGEMFDFDTSPVADRALFVLFAADRLDFDDALTTDLLAPSETDDAGLHDLEPERVGW